MFNFLNGLKSVLLIILTGGIYFLLQKNKKLEDENGSLKITNEIHNTNNRLDSDTLDNIVANHNEEIKSRKP